MELFTGFCFVLWILSTIWSIFLFSIFVLIYSPLDEDEHGKDISDDDGNNNKKKEEEPEIENQEEKIDPSHHQETEHTSTREFNEKDISVTDVIVTVESKDFVEDRNFTENEIIAKDDGDDDDNAKLVDDPEVWLKWEMLDRLFFDKPK